MLLLCLPCLSPPQKHRTNSPGSAEETAQFPSSFSPQPQTEGLEEYH